MTVPNLRTLAAMLAVLPLAAPAAADPVPRLEIGVAAEIEGNSIFDADDPDAEGSDLYTTIEPSAALWLTPALSVTTDLVFEPVRDLDPREDRAFRDHGLYAETLAVNLVQPGFSLSAGKYNPTFGRAWDLMPGLFGDEFTSDYELTERLGFTGTVNIGEAGLSAPRAGNHALSLSVFRADTTLLSDSAFTKRGRTRVGDGGVSNTDSLGSFSVTLDGGGHPLFPQLGYTLGFVHQEQGATEIEDETGWVAGLFADLAFGDVTVLPIAEVARFSHAEGQDQERTYVTLGAGVTWDRWYFAANWTGRNTRTADPADDDPDDRTWHASIGYEIVENVLVDAGYRNVRDAGLDSHTVGIRIATEWNWLLPM